MLSVTGIRGAARKFTMLGIAAVVISVNFAVPLASADCATGDTSRGVAEATVTLPQDGTYRVWVRIKANGNNNSVLLNVDSVTCGVVVGDGEFMKANDWSWVDYQAATPSNKISLSLTAGSHAIKVIGREDDVLVDRLIFTTDTACVPANLGDNCAGSTVAKSTLSISAGSKSALGSVQTKGGSSLEVSSTKSANVLVAVPNNGKTIVAGTVTLQPVASDANEIIRVEYYIDGKQLAAKETPPFSYTLNSKTYRDGAHGVVTKTYYADGSTAISKQVLDVQNDAFLQKANTTATTGLLLAVIAGLLYSMRRRTFIIPHQQLAVTSSTPGKRDKHVNVHFKTIIKPTKTRRPNDE